MSNFRAEMDTQSKNLVNCFSLLEDTQPFRHYGTDGELPEIWGEFVSSAADFDVKCDLTFRQVRNVMSPPLLGSIVSSQKMYLTEALAIANISQFCERMNNACYRKSYKRYGKRISVVSAIEGGRREVRYVDNYGKINYRKIKTNKRLHAHLLLSRPSHIDYYDFRNLVSKNWYATRWGYDEMVIEQINSVSRSAKYGVKVSMDNLDTTNTIFYREKQDEMPAVLCD